QLLIRNDSDKPLHATVSNTGIPAEGQEIPYSQGLRFNTIFTDMNGNPLEPGKLPQGKDFMAEVTILGDRSRDSYKIEDIAMTMVMPSGWQIRNERLEGNETPQG